MISKLDLYQNFYNLHFCCILRTKPIFFPVIKRHILFDYLLESASDVDGLTEVTDDEDLAVVFGLVARGLSTGGKAVVCLPELPEPNLPDFPVPELSLSSAYAKFCKSICRPSCSVYQPI